MLREHLDADEVDDLLTEPVPDDEYDEQTIRRAQLVALGGSVS